MIKLQYLAEIVLLCCCGSAADLNPQVIRSYKGTALNLQEMNMQNFVEKLIQKLLLRLRGGSNDDPDKTWNPKVFDVVSSPYLKELGEICKTEPTAKEVYELAKKLNPYDKSLLCGIQRMSISGHRDTIARIYDLDKYCNGPLIDEEEKMLELLLRYRERIKQWNITNIFPDALIDELRRTNLTMRDIGDLPIPPGGWPTHRPELVDEVLRNFSAALLLAPRSAEVHWRAAIWTAFARGIAPLATLWDPEQRYALVPTALDRAEGLFRRALELAPASLGANSMFGKFLEVVRSKRRRSP